MKYLIVLALFLALARPSLAAVIKQTVIIKSSYALTTRSQKQQKPAPKAVHYPSKRSVATGVSDAQDYVVSQAIKRFGASHVDALIALINSESHFRPYAMNAGSGACGIFQFYPCSKLPCDLSDVPCQTKAGLDYIQRRYGTPSEAWNFKLANNWY